MFKTKTRTQDCFSGKTQKYKADVQDKNKDTRPTMRTKQGHEAKDEYKKDTRLMMSTIQEHEAKDEDKKDTRP